MVETQVKARKGITSDKKNIVNSPSSLGTCKLPFCSQVEQATWVAGGCSVWKPFTRVSSSDYLRLLERKRQRLLVCDMNLMMKLFPGFQDSNWWGTKWPAVLERTSQESLSLTLEWGRSKAMLSACFIGVLMPLDVRWCKRDQDLAFSALTAICGWEVFLFGW